MPMKLHLHADEANGTHTRFTVFMNGANCGQLCMREEEALYFQQLIETSGYRIKEDLTYSTGKWFIPKKGTNQ